MLIHWLILTACKYLNVFFYTKKKGNRVHCTSICCFFRCFYFAHDPMYTNNSENIYLKHSWDPNRYYHFGSDWARVYWQWGVLHPSQISISGNQTQFRVVPKTPLFRTFYPSAGNTVSVLLAPYREKNILYWDRVTHSESYSLFKEISQ